VAGTEQKRRSGWLWLWITLFVAAVIVLLLWAWPSPRPTGSGTDLSSAVRIAAAATVAPAGATGRTANAIRPAHPDPILDQAVTLSSITFSASRFERL
jgi:hypothetical protein